MAASPDGKSAVCAYRGPGAYGAGLLLVDLAKGTTREITRHGSAWGVPPAFSPSGRRIAFARTPGVAWQSNAARELWELDLRTGKLTQVNRVPYHAVWSPAYRGEDRLFFTGEVVTGPYGEGKRVVTEFLRKEGRTKVRPLVDASLRLIGFSADGRTFYGLASRKPRPDRYITRGGADEIASPAAWKLTDLRTGEAALAPSRREVLYLSQNERHYFICRYTLADGKSKALLKLPR